MAKAYFDCAKCDNKVLVVGRNRRDADRISAWHESQGHICDECQLKQQAEDNAKAAKDNQLSGLPPLTGSEKQVAWAEAIRKSRLDNLSYLAPIMSLMRSVDFARTATAEEREQVNASMRTILNSHDANLRIWLHQNSQELMRVLFSAERFTAMGTVFCRQTSARWWIDSRDIPLAVMATKMAEEIEEVVAANNTVSEEQTEIVREAEAEALLKPTTDAQSSQVAEISLVGKELRVVFLEKREDFRLLMRGMGFRWADRFWLRTLGFTTGDPIDRMAETAHRILAIGYMVRLHDDHAREKAVSGKFDPEQTRWVVQAVGGPYDGWVKIIWPRSDDLYVPAKAILGSRYKDGAIFCPPGSIIEVSDFAEKYGFTMSKTPTMMLAKHKAALSNGVVVTDIKAAIESLTDCGETPSLIVPDGNIDNELLDNN